MTLVAQFHVISIKLAFPVFKPEDLCFLHETSDWEVYRVSSGLLFCAPYGSEKMQHTKKCVDT